MRSAPPFEFIMKAWPYSRSQSAGRFGLVSMAATSQRMEFCLPLAKTRQAMFLDGDWKPVGSWAWAGLARIRKHNPARAVSERKVIWLVLGCFLDRHART